MVEETFYPERYPNYTISNKNMTFAFRLDDEDGKFLYVVFSYVEICKISGGLEPFKKICA